MNVQSLPFQGTSPTSRRCSLDGAIQAQPKAGSQAAKVLACLRVQARTLHELSSATGLPVSTICARVGWLRQQGLVEVLGAKPGPYGTANTIWRAK